VAKDAQSADGRSEREQHRAFAGGLLHCEQEVDAFAALTFACIHERLIELLSERRPHTRCTALNLFNEPAAERSDSGLGVRSELRYRLAQNMLSKPSRTNKTQAFANRCRQERSFIFSELCFDSA
jgi:hypothetical protein